MFIHHVAAKIYLKDNLSTVFAVYLLQFKQRTSAKFKNKGATFC